MILWGIVQDILEGLHSSVILLNKSLFKTAILLVPNQCDAEEVQELAQQNGACNVLCIFSSSKCVNICDMTLRSNIKIKHDLQFHTPSSME